MSVSGRIGAGLHRHHVVHFMTLRYISDMIRVACSKFVFRPLKALAQTGGKLSKLSSVHMQLDPLQTLEIDTGYRKCARRYLTGWTGFSLLSVKICYKNELKSYFVFTVRCLRFVIYVTAPEHNTSNCSKQAVSVVTTTWHKLGASA